MNFQNLKHKIRDIKLRLSGATTIHCLGDSHLAVFEYLDKANLLRNTRLQICIVQGATAMGIPNPASKTQAGPIFEKYLKRVPLEHYILTCLGEVDCGFVIWYRSKKYGESVEKQFDLAVGNYINFLKKLEQEGRKNLIVCSTPLPTIKDGQKWGEVATLRNEVDATLCQRTELTVTFNNALRKYCSRHNIIYLDIESYILNKNTKLIDDKFLNPDKLDHHLYSKVLAKVIVIEMAKNGLCSF